MLKRTVLGTLCAITLVFANAAQAQVRATLVLRSGERVSGQLVDMGGHGLTMTVNGKNRQVRKNEVAAIEFSGRTSKADWNNFSGTPQVVLRNGQTIDGDLYDISGRSPLKITVRGRTGDRELHSNEIARIILARPSDTQPVAPGRGDAVSVSSREQWTSTGISVTQGQWITVATTGQVRLSADSNDTASAAGSVNRRYAPDSPLPRTFAGTLIGRIDNGQPFVIGAQRRIQMRATGQLYLGVNDDSLGDNDGSFSVDVNTSGGAVPRR